MRETGRKKARYILNWPKQIYLEIKSIPSNETDFQVIKNISMKMLMETVLHAYVWVSATAPTLTPVVYMPHQKYAVSASLVAEEVVPGCSRK